MLASRLLDERESVDGARGGSACRETRGLQLRKHPAMSATTSSKGPEKRENLLGEVFWADFVPENSREKKGGS